MSFTDQLKQATGKNVVYESMKDVYKTFKESALEAAKSHANYYKSFLIVDDMFVSPGQKRGKIFFIVMEDEMLRMRI